MNKSKLKNLLAKLTTPDDKTLEGFKAFDDGVAKLKNDLKEKIQVATLDDVNNQLDSFKKKIDFDPLTQSIEDLKKDFSSEVESLNAQLEQKVYNILDTAEAGDKEIEKNLTDEAEILNLRITDLIAEKNKQLEKLKQELLNADKASDEQTATKITELDLEILEVKKDVFTNKEETSKGLDTLTKAIPALKTELMSRIDSRGGGSMNRKITFGGTDYLKRYTDINYKAGSNITFTVVNNDQTKMVDVTIASSGGGGGTVRSINSISTPTTAGATAGTDYVYLVSGTTTITLPTAVGNSNLYTIKNVGTGVVTVAFNGAETGDGQTTLVMPVQYTSIDLISDTANWNVT